MFTVGNSRDWPEYFCYIYVLCYQFFVCLSGGFRPTREFFTHVETSFSIYLRLKLNKYHKEMRKRSLESTIILM